MALTIIIIAFIIILAATIACIISISIFGARAMIMDEFKDSDERRNDKENRRAYKK